LQRKVSRINIILLYSLMLIFPLSYTLSTLGGHAINAYNLFIIQPFYNPMSPLAKLTREIHSYSAYVLGICFTLHILAAFYHHYVVKDYILRRMLPD